MNRSKSLSKAQTWASLSAQIELSKQFFGATGPKRLQAWLGDQVTRIDDPAFARLFSSHIKLPWISEPDFNHRHVTCRSGALLGGIRFFGGDVGRPFVEVIAHTFQDSAEGIEALSELVANEWQAFEPQHLRLLLTPEQLNAFTGRRPILVDMSVHAARYKDMQAPNGHVSLATFKTADAAIDLVQQRYQGVAEHDTDLANNISAAVPEDIRDWHDAGQIHAITVKEDTVGLLAVSPGTVEWIDGDEINEEVIAAPHTGNGYASEAQKSLAASIKDQNRLLLGTIDRLNLASRKTAEAAGRSSVLNYTFVNLQASTDGAKCS